MAPHPHLDPTVAAVLAVETKKSKTLYHNVEDWLVTLTPPTIGGVELRDMSRFHLTVPVGVLYVMAYVGILLGLTLYGTTTTLNTKFLALDNLDANSICIEVPQDVTGTYEATWDGYWVTERDFDYAKSLFALEFTGSSIGLVEYEAAMQYFSEQLAVLGQKAKSRNTAWAMLIYGSFSFSVESAHMRFYSTSDGALMFFNKVQTVTLTGRNGACDPYNTTGKFISGLFDRPNKALFATVPVALNPTNLKAMGNGFNVTLTRKFQEACSNVVDFVPSAFNAAFGTNRNGLDFSFDISTVMTVLSLNLGIIKASSLTKISARIRMRKGDPTPILNYEDLVAYIDPNSFSPDRIPVYCYDKTSPALQLTAAQVAGPDICFMGSRDGGQEVVTIYYPTMAQVWNNPSRINTHLNSKMEVCKCPDQKYNPYCAYQDIIWGMIFDNGNATSTAGNLKAIALKFQDYVISNATHGDVNALDYLADILTYSANVDYAKESASDKIQNFTLDGVEINNAWADNKSYNELLQRAWDVVCPWRTCSAFVFETFSDESNYAYLGMNKYHVQMGDFVKETFVATNPVYAQNPTAMHTAVMCSDSISLKAGMAKLAQKPPIALTQSYYECKPTLSAAVVNAFGSAAGSASLFVQVGTIVVGSLIVMLFNGFLWQTGKSHEMLMPKDQKADVVRKYESLKVAAMCDMMQATSEMLNALKVMSLRAEARIQEVDKKADQTKALAMRAASGRKPKQRKADRTYAAANAPDSGTETEEEEYEEEEAEGAEGVLGAAAGKGGESPELARIKTFLTPIEDKKRAAMEKAARDESDVAYFQQGLHRTFERFKFLFQVEDVALAEEELQEAQRMREQQLMTCEGDSDVGSEYGSEVGSEVSGATGGTGGASADVLYPLSFLNPFTYIASPDPVPPPRASRNARASRP